MDGAAAITPPPSDDDRSHASQSDNGNKLPAAAAAAAANPEKQLELEQELQQQQQQEEDIKNGVSQSVPPSHILEDGRFIYLPPPNAAERSRFFERSIARLGILEADMNKQNVNKHQMEEEDEDREQEEDAADDMSTPKIHPLAVASARLQSNGLNELNRAINLATLVQTGEYFSYTNIVDPSLEADAAASAAATTATKSTSGGASAAAPASSSNITELNTQRTEALFCLKRKVTQFEKASTVLKRHEKRLRAGIQAQRVIDRRLFQLRQQWRLVAPEHGVRARLHATRTTEGIAIDVDVYDRNRVVAGGGILGNNNNNQNNNDSRKAISPAGRLASRVPRFATIELQDDFAVQSEKEKITTTNSTTNGETKNEDVEMVDAGNEAKSSQDAEIMENADHTKVNGDKSSKTKAYEDLAKYTRAEPFAVADPSLGRVMENFDPSKIPMLNLQLDIQKRSTGFLQSARLEPTSTLTVGKGNIKRMSNNSAEDRPSSLDEDLLISLQHSLFCANLFESMSSELDPEHAATGTKSATSTFSAIKPKTLQSMAWLSSDSDENFVPPPSFLVGRDATRGLAELSVIHCHEGEVKVQLDCEYQLCLKLVEANAEEGMPSPLSQKEATPTTNSLTEDSGSQSPAQLHALCRALLLHAQDVYHKHSLYLGDRAKKKREEEAAAKGDAPRGLARIKKEDIPEKPRILQSCVSLGCKMLFEQRIRRALSRISAWVSTTYGESMQVEWLPLSIFDLHSKFTISYCQYVVDGVIARDKLTLTQITDTEDYRKVHFHSEKEFEIFLRLELKRQMKQ